MHTEISLACVEQGRRWRYCSTLTSDSSPMRSEKNKSPDKVVHNT